VAQLPAAAIQFLRGESRSGFTKDAIKHILPHPFRKGVEQMRSKGAQRDFIAPKLGRIVRGRPETTNIALENVVLHELVLFGRGQSGDFRPFRANGETV
jgi:hypothetical protein